MPEDRVTSRLRQELGAPISEDWDLLLTFGAEVDRRRAATRTSESTAVAVLRPSVEA